MELRDFYFEEKAQVGVFVFLVVGVAPVKIIKMIANIFK